MHCYYCCHYHQHKHNEHDYDALRKVKIRDNEYDLIGDYAINNIIYRPTELEDICIYEQLMLYELKKIQQKKKKRDRM